METTQNRRRDSFRIVASDLQALRQELNRVFLVIEERLSQVDAVAQNPDLKGRTLANVGGIKLSGVERLTLTVSDPPTQAEVESLRDAVNALASALGAA